MSIVEGVGDRGLLFRLWGLGGFWLQGTGVERERGRRGGGGGERVRPTMKKAKASAKHLHLSTRWT